MSISNKIKYLILILILIIFLRLTYFFLLTKNYKKIDLDNFINLAETGDIILFKCKFVEFLDFKINLTSFFTHCGIVIEKNNKKYILESFSKNDYEKFNDEGGSALIDLKSRIDDYNGGIYIIKLKNKLQYNKKIKLLNELDNYLKYDFYEKYPYLYLNKCILKYNISKNDNEVFCSELVHMILKDLGLVNQNEYSSCKLPIHLFRLDIYDKNNYYRLK